MIIENTKIVINEQPIITSITDWFSLYPGRYAIGKNNKPDSAIIYAYSDDDADIPLLANMAEEKKLMTYHSIPIEGVL